MLRKVFFISLILFLSTFIFINIFSFAVETLTLTTYYPSPYGVYNDLLSWRLAVGDNDGSGTPNTGDIPAGLNIGDLVLSGKLGVGTGTVVPTYRLELQNCAGGFCAAKPDGETWTNLSDIRLKNNVHTIANPLEMMAKLRGVTYQWRNPAKHSNMTGIYMGMIAQEVEKVFPEWVGTDANGYKNLTYIGFNALTVESIKILKAKMESLNKENNALKTKNKQLENKLKDLAKKVEVIEKLISLSFK